MNPFPPGSVMPQGHTPLQWHSLCPASCPWWWWVSAPSLIVVWTRGAIERWPPQDSFIPSWSAPCALGKSDRSAGPLILSGGLPRGGAGKMAAGCGEAKTPGDLTAIAYCPSLGPPVPLLLVLLKPVSCVSFLNWMWAGEGNNGLLFTSLSRNPHSHASGAVPGGL